MRYCNICKSVKPDRAHHCSICGRLVCRVVLICIVLTYWHLVYAFSALTLLVGQQERHLVCKKTEWWGAGVVVCLEQGADLHMAQLMPLPLTVSCLSKIQICFYRAMLCIRGTSHGPVSVCLSVCVCHNPVFY